ncbi:Unknown protein, partial [Striga hermonthica]
PSPFFPCACCHLPSPMPTAHRHAPAPSLHSRAIARPSSLLIFSRALLRAPACRLLARPSRLIRSRRDPRASQLPPAPRSPTAPPRTPVHPPTTRLRTPCQSRVAR